MYLKTMTAKGNKYIYLYCYSNEIREENPRNKEKRLYSFGRNDIALVRLKSWKKDFSSFPDDLKSLGCTKRDLIDWLRTLETGITKTGKRFKAVI